ncbi:uncharacterized protein LOC130700535 [Daphnia carinata]|uniref:uncharacterized protein LOC130700535 n=1 Tax=Daphnia carinata TaxID=120202 RepID=UPI00257FCC14|nr:uncharacterized protein LOC130700535 [Daphnia carinata]
MQVKWLCVLLIAPIVSVIASSLTNRILYRIFVPFTFTTGDLQDNQNGRATRQLSFVTRQLVANSTTVNIACAKLVNVTGPCRRRRGLWAEEPIVLSFDEETEKLTEILFTPPYKLEPTQIPNVTVNDVPSSSTSGTTVTSVEDGRLITSMRESRHRDSPHSRIYFPYILGLVTRFISALTAGRPSSTIQVTPILDGGILPVFESSQAEVTVTVTNTFFVQVCTPSPFPFSECLQFRKRN